MPDDINWGLLDRFFAGECTPAERADVLHWLETHPLPAKYVQALKQAMQLSDRPGAPSAWETDASWERLAQTTGIAPEPRPAAPLRLVPPRRRWSLPSGPPLMRVAAIVTLLLGSGAFWWSVTRHAPRPAAMREFTTARGQRAEMRLADGTRILLSVDSKLRVPGDYGTAARDVYLDGEAYFEVTHDATKPFSVHAANALVRDLGTRFGVRAYASELRVRVVVAEGKVAMRSATAADTVSPAPVLSPGDLGRLDASGALSLAQGVNVQRYLAWTDGRLAFQDAPLRDVLPDLARWYDLDLTLAAASLGDRRLTFTVDGEPLTQVLDGIALLAHARYERTGRSVTFYPARGAQ
jgi:transmembrane sensor